MYVHVLMHNTAYLLDDLVSFAQTHNIHYEHMINDLVWHSYICVVYRNASLSVPIC